jgi:hypothetical protein
MRIGMDARALMTDMTDPKTKFRLLCGPFWRIWADIAPDPVGFAGFAPI